VARYVAFLRGVSPQNAKMADLKRCLEEAGFAGVRTVLASGNVVFETRAARPQVLEQQLEHVIESGLGRRFGTIVRSAEQLGELIAADPFAEFDLAPGAKRVVTFLRRPPASTVALPVERDGVRILKLAGAEVFTAYVPNQKGPVFMSMLEEAFGKDITTRTLDTLKKCLGAPKQGR
jgi:uncharacterized protein (DUF1697 family)